jgi:schlafen family protein
LPANDRAKDLFEQFVVGGEETIDRFIAEEISEELFIDYKRSSSDGNEKKLSQTDRENFARAIAGFGNSEGGIIVWGVDCRTDPERGDVPSGKYPLQNPKRFVSYLEGASSGCTLPPVVS